VLRRADLIAFNKRGRRARSSGGGGRAALRASSVSVAASGARSAGAERATRSGVAALWGGACAFASRTKRTETLDLATQRTTPARGSRSVGRGTSRDSLAVSQRWHETPKTADRACQGKASPLEAARSLTWRKFRAGAYATSGAGNHSVRTAEAEAGARPLIRMRIGTHRTNTPNGARRPPETAERSAKNAKKSTGAILKLW